MGFGQVCKCTSCDFVFYSGHNHHAGSSCAVCKNCLTRFELPTKSFWGPQVGELVEFHRVLASVAPGHKRKKPRIVRSSEPTGEYLLAEPIEGSSLVSYPVAEICCPSCKAAGSMALDFLNGEDCPACKTGKLECADVMY